MNGREREGMCEYIYSSWACCIQMIMYFLRFFLGGANIHIVAQMYEWHAIERQSAP